MPRRSLTSLLLCLALRAGVAHAEEATATAPDDLCEQEPRCSTLSAEGVRRSEHKDYSGAMHAFQEAYAVASEPRLLINIGRCLYRMGQPAQALTYYRRPEVRRIADRDDVHERLQQRIEEAEVALRAERAQLLRTTPAPRPPLPPPPPPRRPRWRVGLGATSVTLGLLTMAGATAALLLNDTCVNEAPGGCQARLLPDGSRVAQVHDTAQLGYGLLGGGGALFLIGVILWGVPPRQDARN